MAATVRTIGRKPEVKQTAAKPAERIAAKPQTDNKPVGFVLPTKLDIEEDNDPTVSITFRWKESKLAAFMELAKKQGFESYQVFLKEVLESLTEANL